jgi:hypothetical protein
VPAQRRKLLCHLKINQEKEREKIVPVETKTVAVVLISNNTFGD